MTRPLYLVGDSCLLVDLEPEKFPASSRESTQPRICPFSGVSANHLLHAGARRKNTGVEKTFGLKPQEFSDIGSRYMSKRLKIPFFSCFHSRVAAFDVFLKGAVERYLSFLCLETHIQIVKRPFSRQFALEKLFDSLSSQRENANCASMAFHFPPARDARPASRVLTRNTSVRATLRALTAFPLDLRSSRKL